MTITRRLATALLAISLPLRVAADVSTSAPSALLVFPLISVDTDTGTDTRIEIANTDATPVTARCVFENPSGPGGAPAFTPFTIRLPANQPVAWFAGAGLTAVPGDGGSIPALASATGVLRCVAADAAGTPAARNVLVGGATIDRFLLPAAAGPVVIDSARYNATGLAALPGAANGDDHLALGGPAGEYDACPATLILPSFLDGAVLDLGAAGTVHRTLATTVALVTCAQHGTSETTAALDLSLTNEFGQSFAATATVREQLVTPLSRLDTGNPTQSIFAVGTQGSLTATIQIAPRAGGVLGIVLPAYVDPTNDTNRHTAALSPQLAGAVDAADAIDLDVPTPPPATTPVATASATPPRTATASPSCAGDCNGDGVVAINELITGVNIALGSEALAMCPSLDLGGTGQVTISDLVVAVNHALSGC